MDIKFSDLDSNIELLRKNIEMNKLEIDTKLGKAISEFKSTSRLHNWMFGTIITLNVGIFLTLISIIYSVLSR
ncbi:BDR-repeat family protein [Borrelia duttonii CR2A]|uniref:BDR-repeat family protein n=1 Tax=Borrelia duttonii CR2A TaxID=1432657 RepID=W6TGF7_9SPIR|nr:BDR-repeat family protein [Borrelia duttonii CR2A]